MNRSIRVRGRSRKKRGRSRKYRGGATNGRAAGEGGNSAKVQDPVEVTPDPLARALAVGANTRVPQGAAQAPPGAPQIGFTLNPGETLEQIYADTPSKQFFGKLKTTMETIATEDTAATEDAKIEIAKKRVVLLCLVKYHLSRWYDEGGNYISAGAEVEDIQGRCNEAIGKIRRYKEDIVTPVNNTIHELSRQLELQGSVTPQNVGQMRTYIEGILTAIMGLP